jgi:hypothetical protein
VCGYIHLSPVGNDEGEVWGEGGEGGGRCQMVFSG